MRRVAATGLFVCVVSVLAHTADVLSQLGIPVQAAKQAVGAVLNGGVYNPGLPAGGFKVLPAAARAEVAAAGVAWLKTYVASAEFAQQYAQIRESRKPLPPQFAGTPEDEVKKADEQQKQEMEESKAALAALPPAQRAQIEEAMKAAQAMTAQLNTPEMRKMRLDAVKAERAERTTQYEQELASWRRNFPESAAPLVAKRLREFLAASADVDFAATLTPRNGKMVFANPAYEQKPGQWKICYRAGKDATMAARAAVQAWLKELGG
jgi:PAS domain-containing protein